MEKQKMQVGLLILFLFLGTSTAKSHRPRIPEGSSGVDDASAESKVSSRYAHKAPHSYILEEDDHYPHGHHIDGHSEGYLDSEDAKSHKENEEAQGDENLDKTVKKDEYDDHSEKEGHQEFQAGGVAFDKHLKDHKADNKEIENVKGHDIGEKYGGEAVKENKKGKHKEKSKGHKLHGFKNVYHKEEYGDHKTFHDEFLDSDHLHNYDDHHEHQEMQGGKFSKAYKHEGKNKKYDKGDEKHEWGKEDFDGHHEGKREKGGESSKHRHTAKKQQGHFHADAQRNKNSVHKIKKGSPPEYVHHVGHHGPHQAQIQPYVSHNPHHHHQVHVPSHHHKPYVHQPHHEAHFDEDHESYSNQDGHISDNDAHKSQGSDHGGHNINDDEHDDHHAHHFQDSSEEHDDDYEERVSHKPQNKLMGKERVSGVKEDQIIQKHEPVNHEQSVSTGHSTHQYRQPLVYVERYKQPEYTRHEKIPHSYNDKFQRQNHRILYGHQPRNHHHHNHYQRQHFRRIPVFDHNKHPHHHHHQKHQFPRFPGFDHRHRSYGRHSHKTHLRHMPSAYKEELKPTVLAHIQPTDTKLVQNEGQHRISQNQYE